MEELLERNSQIESLEGQNYLLKMPFGISNRHLHLSDEHFKHLTGKSVMNAVKHIRQPGQFVTSDKFFLEYDGKILQGSRGNSYVGLIGPGRKESQVELLGSDFLQLGIGDYKTRMSGDLINTHGIKIISAETGNELVLQNGVIRAKDHAHFEPETAAKYGIKSGESIRVGLQTIDGIRMYNNVEAKVSPHFLDEIHIDQQGAPKSLFSEAQHLAGLEALVFKNNF